MKALSLTFSISLILALLLLAVLFFSVELIGLAYLLVLTAGLIAFKLD